MNSSCTGEPTNASKFVTSMNQTDQEPLLIVYVKEVLKVTDASKVPNVYQNNVIILNMSVNNE
jgi:hypothetical protein